MAKNKVHVKIAGASYTIVTDEDPDYVEEIAEDVNASIMSISDSSRQLSTVQCAVLAALDYADSAKKASASADNLRVQVKDYLEDAARSKVEVDAARREVERLNREISNLRAKLKS